MTPFVSAILLAAGYSSRMGSVHKALLPLGVDSMLGLAIDALHKGGVRDIRVVTGNACEEIAKAAACRDVRAVHNPDFPQGMFSSICAGAVSLLEDAARPGGIAPEAVLILPVDGALAREHSVTALLTAWRELEDASRRQAVIIPSFQKKAGHPPILGIEHLSAVLQNKPEGGLRGYLASLLNDDASASFLRGEAVPARFFTASPTRRDMMFSLAPAGVRNSATPFFFLPLPDAGVLSDLDTPADVEQAEAFLRMTRNRRSPAPVEAWEWLSHAGLSTEKIRHCLSVALGALRLALALERAGKQTDPLLHVCGGMLHDIARCKKNHTGTGFAMVQKQGWPNCALVVGAHTVLPDPLLAAMGILSRDMPVTGGGARSNPPGAAVPKELYVAPAPSLLYACASVYMADKLFSGDKQVSLAERFAMVKTHCAWEAHARDGIEHREKIAGAVKEWFKGILGEEPDSIIAHQEEHAQEAWLCRLLSETN